MDDLANITLNWLLFALWLVLTPTLAVVIEAAHFTSRRLDKRLQSANHAVHIYLLLSCGCLILAAVTIIFIRSPWHYVLLMFSLSLSRLFSAWAFSGDRQSALANFKSQSVLIYWYVVWVGCWLLGLFPESVLPVALATYPADGRIGYSLMAIASLLYLCVSAAMMHEWRHHSQIQPNIWRRYANLIEFEHALHQTLLFFLTVFWLGLSWLSVDQWLAFDDSFLYKALWGMVVVPVVAWLWYRARLWFGWVYVLNRTLIAISVLAFLAMLLVFSVTVAQDWWLLTLKTIACVLVLALVMSPYLWFSWRLINLLAMVLVGYGLAVGVVLDAGSLPVIIMVGAGVVVLGVLHVFGRQLSAVDDRQPSGLQLYYTLAIAIAVVWLVIVPSLTLTLTAEWLLFLVSMLALVIQLLGTSQQMNRLPLWFGLCILPMFFVEALLVINAGVLMVGLIVLSVMFTDRPKPSVD